MTSAKLRLAVRVANTVSTSKLRMGVLTLLLLYFEPPCRLGFGQGLDSNSRLFTFFFHVTFRAFVPQ